MEPSTASVHIEKGNGEIDVVRPLAEFSPDIWSDIFFNYTSPHEIHFEIKNQMEKEVCDLKEQVRKELLTVKDPKERLVLIDAIQRLGVAYHFDKEIEAYLQAFDINYVVDCSKDDLRYTSLRFRLLRQHGFLVSCDVFDKFMNENGKFKESLASDMQGILNLYEASYLGLHGEKVLDEALSFTTSLLTSLASKLSYPINVQITHALKRPLDQRPTRHETKHQISFYESNVSHNEALLKLAKLDFNLLQLLHKKELSDLIRWARKIDFKENFPFSRDRMVEGYIYSLGVCYEPYNSYSRIITNKILKLITVIDDIFDSYGTIDELQPFTEAIISWNNSCINQLPDYMKLMYQIVLDTFEGLERDLAEDKTSHFVSYLREEFKVNCQAYLVEAKWCHYKYIPTYDEYMKNAHISCTLGLMVMATYQTKGRIATQDSIEWIYNNSKALKASRFFSRILNDIGGHKIEQERNHVASAVECYMENYGVSEKDAYKELMKKVEEEWKNMKEEMFIPPTLLPNRPLLKDILNVSRSVLNLYDIDKDYYTNSKYMQEQIEALLIDPAI